MCKFLSAIVMRDGSVICDPEHTDSHEDLILANNINDGVVDHMREHFCRVEFVPPDAGDIADLSLWTLALDEQAEPTWWSEKRDGVRAYLVDLVKAHIIVDKRPLLLGGWWIVCGSAEICRVVTAAIRAVRDSASITNVRGLGCDLGRQPHCYVPACRRNQGKAQDAQEQKGGQQMSPAIPLFRRKPHPHPHLDVLPPCQDYLPDWLNAAPYRPPSQALAVVGAVMWTIATAIVAFMAGAAWVMP